MLSGRLKLVILIIILLKLKISLIIVYKTASATSTMIIDDKEICLKFYNSLGKYISN
jgi:hypothetical protein